MVLLLNKKREENLLQAQYDKCTKWLKVVNNIPDNSESLIKLFNAHQGMWRDGIRNKNIGPDPYGMFRTDDIEKMYPFQVYLGNIDGLFTNTLEFFENEKDKVLARQKAEGKPLVLPDFYSTVYKQYRHHLASNIRDIRAHIFDKGVSRDILAKNVMEAANLLLDRNDVKGGVSGLEFTVNSLAENRILDCKMSFRGIPVCSSILNANGRYLIPEGFERGVQITPKDAFTRKYHDVFDVLVCLKEGRKEEPKLVDLSKLDVKKVKNATHLIKDMSRKEIRENKRSINLYKHKGYSFGI